MAEAYEARHPYHEETYDVLGRLAEHAGSAAASAASVLELGAGTGRLTYGLADIVGVVDAVEPSPAMVEAARRTRDHPGVRWIVSTFEDAILERPYRLAVGGESVHWLDWEVAFDKLVMLLEPGAFLALVGIVELEPGSNVAGPRPWHHNMMRLIIEYSVNDEFEPYSLVPALEAAKRFEVAGRHRTPAVTIAEPVAKLVRRLHSSNGLGPARLGERRAEFDERMIAALEPHASNGLIVTDIATEIVWGHPLPTR